MTMSMILWDIFTGSAPYRDVLMRSMAPKFALRFAGQALKALRGNSAGTSGGAAER